MRRPKQFFFKYIEMKQRVFSEFPMSVPRFPGTMTRSCNIHTRTRDRTVCRNRFAYGEGSAELNVTVTGCGTDGPRALGERGAEGLRALGEREGAERAWRVGGRGAGRTGRPGDITGDGG